MQDSGLANWAAKVKASASSSGAEVSPRNFRKSIYLEIYNEAGQLMVSYRISGEWIIEHLPQEGLQVHNLKLRYEKMSQEKLAAIFRAP